MKENRKILMKMTPISNRSQIFEQFDTKSLKVKGRMSNFSK